MTVYHFFYSGSATLPLLRASAATAVERLSHRSSVRLFICLSVTRVDQSKTVQARITRCSHRLPGRL